MYGVGGTGWRFVCGEKYQRAGEEGYLLMLSLDGMSFP